MESASVVPVQRWRLVVRRRPDAPPLQQKEWLGSWEDTIRRSGLPAATTAPGADRPRMAVGAALPVGIPAERELLDIFLVRRLPRWQVRAALEPMIPDGHDLVDLYDVWLGEPALPGRIAGSVYRALLRGSAGSVAELRAAAHAMLAAASLPRERPKGNQAVSYDLRPFLVALSVEPGEVDGTAEVRVHLRHDPERGVGRPDEVLAELADRLGRPIGDVALVRERLLLAGDLPVEAARPPGA
jgi:radical SAM-linked protein